MPIKNELKILVASDDQHDRVFAEIYIGDKFVGLVSQESGPGLEEVELPGTGLNEATVLRQLPVAQFNAAIQEALDKLRGARGRT